MTSLALAQRRFRLRLAGLGVEAIALAVLALISVIAAFMALAPRGEAAPAKSVTVRMTPAKASAMVEATTGTDAAHLRAVGDRAKLINASLPFAGGPVHAASPFAVSGDMTDQRRALLCLTQAVYYEAGFEPMAGRRAVAQVVLNRMRHPAFPKSVCGVVYQANSRPVCQFSFVCDGSLYRRPAAAAWNQAESIARAALAGYVEASVGGATHYHADYVAPRWAPMLNKVAKLGAHIFYRWPGAWGLPAAFTGRYVGEPRDPLSMRPAAPSPDAVVPVEGLAIAAVESGPPIARAANDVGGLLDTSKGWTLSIPGPNDAGSAASRLIAAQEAKPAPAVAVAATVPAGGK